MCNSVTITLIVILQALNVLLAKRSANFALRINSCSEYTQSDRMHTVSLPGNCACNEAQCTDHQKMQNLTAIRYADAKIGITWTTQIMNSHLQPPLHFLQ
ncbi:unnamed protein product [Blepharisma stoltei]|uniref:Secreted protein n=1 Tax=Blepharisma stoltei TaxID=1481888 RepID=A0AAU9J2J4_9CILI|nr:unnamed protein product [Blepharisma stoltei]